MGNKPNNFNDKITVEFVLAIVIIVSTLLAYEFLRVSSFILGTSWFGVMIRVSIILGVPVILQYMVPTLFERRTLKRIVNGPSIPRVSIVEFSCVSPWSIIIPMVITVPIEILASDLGFLGRAGETVLGYMFLMYAFVYHRIANNYRSIKYAAFFIGGLLWGQSFSKSNSLDTIMVLRTISVTIYLAVRAMIGPAEDLQSGDRSTMSTLTWYRRTMYVGPGTGIKMLISFFIRYIPFVGDFYWSARICCKERLSRCPVLFLRSFSNRHCADVLGKLVAPAISRVAILAALVHPSQTSAALNRRTHEAWVPITMATPELDWREWFVQQLDQALAVVIDATVMHANTRWELETSVKALGGERVAVLVPVGTQDEMFGAFRVEYTAGQFALSKAKLASWLDEIMRKRFAS